MDKFIIIVSIVLLLSAIAFCTMLPAIWALNTLFHLGIPYELKYMVAGFILVFILGGGIKLVTTKD